MHPQECGFHQLPADGTRDRELVDRFGDFLAAAGPVRSWLMLSPAERYRVRFLLWRMGQI
jgi:hypothetical protein